MVQAKSDTNPRGYMPHLDGLRAVAVMAVLAHHWWHLPLPLGAWGVRLFFVISGYLITRSLLNLRAEDRSLGRTASEFFWHRFLRLTPAYLVLLGIAWVVIPEIQPKIPWYVGYASNFLLAADGRYIPLTPTWSLASEEQFYILWFFAAVLLPTRTLPALLGVLVVAALAFRGAVAASGHHMAEYLLPSAFDALAAGIALCLAERAGWNLPRWASWAAIGCLVLAGAVVLWFGERSPTGATVAPLLIAVAASVAVWRSRTGFKGWVGSLLGYAPVVWLGKISYGLYLYHMISPELVRGLPVLWRAAEHGSLLGFVLHVATTIALAALSFYILEQPLRKLGRVKMRRERMLPV